MSTRKEQQLLSISDKSLRHAALTVEERQVIQASIDAGPLRNRILASVSALVLGGSRLRRQAMSQLRHCCHAVRKSDGRGLKYLCMALMFICRSSESELLGREFLSFLLRAVQLTDRHCRINATAALGAYARRGDAEAIQALKRCLRSKDESVRANALLGLRV
jgi:hypothetical protein